MKNSLTSYYNTQQVHKCGMNTKHCSLQRKEPTGNAVESQFQGVHNSQEEHKLIARMLDEFRLGHGNHERNVKTLNFILSFKFVAKVVATWQNIPTVVYSKPIGTFGVPRAFHSSDVCKEQLVE